MEWINLYLQTEYSLLSSGITIEAAVNKAKKMGSSSLAITDNSMYGVIKFYQACLKSKVKPIIGLQLIMDSIGTDKSVILLYAKNNNGYLNLMNISSYQKVNNGISLEILKQYKKDLIAVIASDEHSIVRDVKAGILSDASELLDDYKSVFDDLYIGIDLQSKSMSTIINDLIDFSKINNIKPVAIHKTNYDRPEDFIVYTTLKSIGQGGNPYIYSEKETNSNFLMKEEVESLFSEYPELINNTNEIASKCNVEIVFGEYRLPKYDIDNSKKFLVELCKLGLNKRLKDKVVNVDIYKNRLFYELDIIDKMGFSDYFLIVYDYVKYAKKNDILVGPGRGSAPGSLVSYVLGITDVDPIEFNLLFERFLNPERISMPDIDVDFPDDRRDEVIRYIGERYGKLKVAHITTFDTFGARMAIRDVARVMKISDDKLNYVLRSFPASQGSLQSILEKSDHLQELINRDDIIKNLYLVATKIEGMPRHTSTHAAGIIMADNDLVKYTPLQQGINGLLQTQYEASDVESLGLVKMDILGIRNLTLIKNVLNDIKREIKVDLNLYKIPLNDSRTFQMIARGDTDGIFQLESAGMRNLLVNLKTSQFMDIVNANALYRPGPMEMIPVFIRRKFGEKIVYIHNDLSDILKDTYGTIVFQEQIMLIAQRFAGYSLGMADVLRRAVSKKKTAVIEKERVKFINGAVNNGYNEKLGNEVYDYIAKFANYGFNKSHSVAYSIISYWMAFLKVNYYQYFMANLMSNSLGNINNIQKYVMECRKNKVDIHPPHINISSDKFIVRDIGIYFPLIGISGVNNVAVQKIMDERDDGPFKSYEDFIGRCNDFINKKMVQKLIHSGSLSCFGISYKQMIETYDAVKDKIAYSSILKNKLITSDIIYDEYSFDEISLMEKEAIGFNIKYSLFIKYAQIKAKYKTVDLNSLNMGLNYIIFIVRNIKEITTKKGDLMAFLEIYDDTAGVDAVLFPISYEKFKDVLVVGSTYIGNGKAEERNGKIQFIIENVYTMK